MGPDRIRWLAERLAQARMTKEADLGRDTAVMAGIGALGGAGMGLGYSLASGRKLRESANAAITGGLIGGLGAGSIPLVRAGFNAYGQSSGNRENADVAAIERSQALADRDALRQQSQNDALGQIIRMKPVVDSNNQRMSLGASLIQGAAPYIRSALGDGDVARAPGAAAGPGPAIPTEALNALEPAGAALGGIGAMTLQRRRAVGQAMRDAAANQLRNLGDAANAQSITGARPARILDPSGAPMDLKNLGEAAQKDPLWKTVIDNSIRARGVATPTPEMREAEAARIRIETPQQLTDRLNKAGPPGARFQYDPGDPGRFGPENLARINAGVAKRHTDRRDRAAWNFLLKNRSAEVAEQMKNKRPARSGLAGAGAGWAGGALLRYLIGRTGDV